MALLEIRRRKSPFFFPEDDFSGSYYKFAPEEEDERAGLKKLNARSFRRL